MLRNLGRARQIRLLRRLQSSMLWHLFFRTPTPIRLSNHAITPPYLSIIRPHTCIRYEQVNPLTLNNQQLLHHKRRTRNRHRLNRLRNGLRPIRPRIRPRRPKPPPRRLLPLHKLRHLLPNPQTGASGAGEAAPTR